LIENNTKMRRPHIATIGVGVSLASLIVGCPTTDVEKYLPSPGVSGSEEQLIRITIGQRNQGQQNNGTTGIPWGEILPSPVTGLTAIVRYHVPGVVEDEMMGESVVLHSDSCIGITPTGPLTRTGEDSKGFGVYDLPLSLTNGCGSSAQLFRSDLYFDGSGESAAFNGEPVIASAEVQW